ncbi:hypothetical protein MK805_02730 [Shimazuella sp. AN120528]|uniref:hypothetical protein n=1 Tax=Shimazuella soli TaxID=1892854 RepID=UPI001F109F84|nr:hypothetical protein [Shimazuella soli]MCH5583883.1 hypothetical protein [Shimazuella soli]
MKQFRFLSLSFLLMTVLLAGCNITKTSQVDPKQNSDTKIQNVMKKSLDAWDNSSKNQIFAWTTKDDQVYPSQEGTYKVLKTGEALEEKYDKSHIHATSSNKSGYAIDQTPSNLKQGESWDQWKAGENTTYSKFIDPSSDDSEFEGKWMKQDQYTGELYVPSLPVDYLNAIKDSKSTKGVTITETSDAYKIVAKPEFYASLPNFLQNVGKKMKFQVYPKAVIHSVNFGNGTMMDYNAQKVKVKSVDCSIVINKKTLLIQEADFHVKLELGLTFGKSPTSDQVITLKKKGELHTPFQVPANVIKAAGK